VLGTVFSIQNKLFVFIVLALPLLRMLLLLRPKCDGEW
jgi:hypothetical protein